MYNVEEYIEKCLDSFVIPAILDELEVLIINDDSPDKSRTLAEMYVRKYPQTFRIIDKENGGHGSTINRGMEEATGKYFKVVDGDDWVDQQEFMYLVQHLRCTDADMVLSNYCWVDHVTGRKRFEVDEVCPGIFYGKTYSISEIGDRIFMKMHAITYRTEILRRQPERLDEHCFYVDTEYILFPLPYVHTVSAIPNVVYQYRIGIPGQSVSLQNKQRRCSQHERVLYRLLDFYNQHQENPRELIIRKVVARVAVSQCKIYLSFSDNHKAAMMKLDSMMKEKYPQIYTSMNHKAIQILRKTHYLVFPIASLILRHIEK